MKTMVNTDSSDPITIRTPSVLQAILLRHSRSARQYSPSTDKLLPQMERMYTWEEWIADSCVIVVIHHDYLTETRRSDIARFNIKIVTRFTFFWPFLGEVNSLRVIRMITTMFPLSAIRPESIRVLIPSTVKMYSNATLVPTEDHHENQNSFIFYHRIFVGENAFDTFWQTLIWCINTISVPVTHLKQKEHWGV